MEVASMSDRESPFGQDMLLMESELRALKQRYIFHARELQRLGPRAPSAVSASGSSGLEEEDNDSNLSTYGILHAAKDRPIRQRRERRASARDLSVAGSLDDEDDLVTSVAPGPANTNPTGIFICPWPDCRKVFDRVKSRSAHLKWHGGDYKVSVGAASAAAGAAFQPPMEATSMKQRHDTAKEAAAASLSQSPPRKRKRGWPTKAESMTIHSMPGPKRAKAAGTDRPSFSVGTAVVIVDGPGMATLVGRPGTVVHVQARGKQGSELVYKIALVSRRGLPRHVVVPQSCLAARDPTPDSSDQQLPSAPEVTQWNKLHDTATTAAYTEEQGEEPDDEEDRTGGEDHGDKSPTLAEASSDSVQDDQEGVTTAAARLSTKCNPMVADVGDAILVCCVDPRDPNFYFLRRGLIMEATGPPSARSFQVEMESDQLHISAASTLPELETAHKCMRVAMRVASHVTDRGDTTLHLGTIQRVEPTRVRIKFDHHPLAWRKADEVRVLPDNFDITAHAVTFATGKRSKRTVKT